MAVTAPNTVPLLLVVAGILVNAHQHVLVAQRAVHKSYPLKWEFPGGKIEPGETPEQALLRELEEELGISCHISDLTPLIFASHTYETFHVLMPIFMLQNWQGTPQNLEHNNLAWVSYHDLATLDFLEADFAFLPKIIKAISSQSHE